MKNEYENRNSTKILRFSKKMVHLESSPAFGGIFDFSLIQQIYFWFDLKVYTPIITAYTGLAGFP